MRVELVRSVVCLALGEILERGVHADRALERALRRHRELTGPERGAVALRVMGVSCLRGRLEYRLDAAVPGWRACREQWLLGAYALLEESVAAEGARSLAGVGAEEDWTRLAKEPGWPADPVERLAAEQSLPRWLAELWSRELGLEEARALAEASNRPGPATLRANLLKASRPELAAALAAEGIAVEAGRWSPEAAHVVGRANLFGSRAWRAGLFEVQDEGSQLIAHLSAPRGGGTFLDFCAGAGGKTLAVAALAPKSRLVALDVDGQKLEALVARAKRAGLPAVEVSRLGPAGEPPPSCREAEVVLVDAPCSSLGTLRRGPDLRWRVKAAELDSLPALQLSILERAAGCVASGGRLVYATCTLRDAENRDVAAAFGARHPEFQLQTREAGGPAVAGAAGLFAPLGTGEALSLAPHRQGTDGFFACSWLRR